jgi:hypothetical protein
MPQLTALEWVGVYLGVGACALVLMRLFVKWVVRPPQQSEFVTEMMAAIRADLPRDATTGRVQMFGCVELAPPLGRCREPPARGILQELLKPIGG